MAHWRLTAALALVPPGSALAEAPAPPPARMLALTPPAADVAGPLCSAALALCIDLVPAEEGLPPHLLVKTGSGDGQRSDNLDLPGLASDDQATLALWDQAITVPPAEGGDPHHGDLLIGLRSTTSTPYSGGGAQATRLHLLHLSLQYGSPRLNGEVVDVPLSSNVLIRACFSEADMRQRAGACHDEYRSGAAITLTGAVADGMPVLGYAIVAESYPGGVSRQEDSLAKGRLRKSDLVWSRDEACSFETTFAFNPTTRRYEASEPGPDCSDYDVP